MELGKACAFKPKGDEKDSADTVLSLPDRWILARLGEVGRDESIALEEYRY
jgi:hypothetical protein